jgi:hypothetical protein
VGCFWPEPFCLELSGFSFLHTRRPSDPMSSSEPLASLDFHDTSDRRDHVLADRNAERPQLVGQVPVLVDRQADVLDVFDAVLDGLVFTVEQFLDRLSFALFVRD